jgi:cytochrome c5
LSTQDQQFFDKVLLVIGMLIAVAIALFVLAWILGGTDQQAVLDDEWHEEQVVARIRPFGQVAFPGDLDKIGVASDAVTATPVATSLSGPQVYNAACVACHGSGIGGAPKMGDAAIWNPRIAQGVDVVRQHAIEGYQGDSGYMPPKGGRLDLSDEEIVAAVDYIVESSR